MPHKRQPGSSPPRRKGLYLDHFRAGELEALSQSPPGVSEEIDLLRVLIRRVFETADSTAQTLDEWVDVLQALGMANIRLARLLRAQSMLDGSGGDGMAAALSAAISQVSRDFNL